MVPTGLYVWDDTFNGGAGGFVPWESTGNAAHVAEVGIPSQRHNRYITTDITTHPGDDTEAVTWTQAENVRRYRIYPIGTAGDLVKVVEDAANGVQADAWLAEAESLTADIEWWLAEANVWSEWKELSKDPSDPSLSRLDFELFTGGTGITELLVEAE